MLLALLYRWFGTSEVLHVPNKGTLSAKIVCVYIVANLLCVLRNPLKTSTNLNYI